ncbi:MAG: M15 family metallopeptidase [Actinomycetota bacterium]
MKPAARNAALAVLVIWGSACGLASPEPVDRPSVIAPSVSVSTGVPAAGPVEVSAPAVLATISSGVLPEHVERARRVPGVTAAARISISNFTAVVDGGASELSLAAVDPREFRPLAPERTSRAEFVWQGLSQGEIILAHEEQGRLGVDLGSRLALEGPAGRGDVRIGGLAANGAPNLAGGMVALDRARVLGSGPPTLLLVGVRPGQPGGSVRKALSRLPGAKTEPVGGAGRAFLSGRAAGRALGSFRYMPGPNGTISPDRSWVSKNIATRKVPILGTVTCHRMMLPQLEGALREFQRAGLAHLVNVGDYHYQGGCYVPRFKRGSSTSLSMHAWGLAIDVNVATNPAGARPRQDPRLVAIFERWGFRWGGRWSPPDGHHFELASLLRS